MCLHTHTRLIQDNTVHQDHPCTPCASGPNSPRRKEQTAEILVEEAQSVLAEAEQKLKRADEVFAINRKKEEGECISWHTIESSHQSIRCSFPG
jgi:DNA topoisomerase IA